MLQLGNNCCSFIAIFAALSSATLKSEQAFKAMVKVRVRAGVSGNIYNAFGQTCFRASVVDPNFVNIYVILTFLASL